MDIYLINKLLSASPVNLACIIIHCMWDTLSTNNSKRVFNFPLWLTDIFRQFNINLSSEQQARIDGLDVIFGLSISRSDFEYNET